ncbi:MAG: DrmE family protein [Blastocatellia bacterium]
MSSLFTALLNSVGRDPVLSFIERMKVASPVDAGKLSDLERCQIALGACTLRQGMNLVCERPLHTSRDSMLLALGCLLEDLVSRNNKELESYGRINGDLWIITNRVGEAINLLKGFGINGVKLSQVWRITSAREFRTLYSEGQGKSIIVASPSELFLIGDLQGVAILDVLTPYDGIRLGAYCTDRESTPSMIVCGPPGISHDLGNRVKNLKLWPKCKLQNYVDSKTNDKRAGAWLRRPSSVEVVSCTAPSIDEPLAVVKDNLVALMREISGKSSIFLRSAWKLYRRLCSLTVPIAYYDHAVRRSPFARSITKQLEYLESLKVTAGDLRSASVQTEVLAVEIIKALRDVYEEIRIDNPKTYAVAEAVNQNSIRQVVTISFQNRMEGEVFGEQADGLIDSPLLMSGKCELLSHRDFYRQVSRTFEFDRVAVFPGGRRSSDLWLDDAYPCNQVLVLYPHEYRAETTFPKCREPDVECDGFWTPAWGLSTNVPSNRLLEIVSDVPDRRKSKRRYGKAAVKFSSDEEWLLTESLDGLEESKPSRPVERRDEFAYDAAQDNEPFVEITLRSGSVFAVPENVEFDVFLPSTQDIVSCQAKSLSYGDRIFLSNDEEISRLYDLIIEALESRPNLRKARIWVDLWWASIRELAARYKAGARIDIVRLHRDLEARGLTVSPAALRLWLPTGEAVPKVMGPQDPENIRVVGELVGSDAVESSWQEIGKVMSKIRGLHREIARKLNDLVLHSAVSSTGDDWDDPDLQIAIEDVLSAGRFEEVVSVWQEGRKNS